MQQLEEFKNGHRKKENKTPSKLADPRSMDPLSAGSSNITALDPLYTILFAGTRIKQRYFRRETISAANLSWKLRLGFRSSIEALWQTSCRAVSYLSML